MPPYNSPQDCVDVCQGLFLFETIEDGFECCRNSRKLQHEEVAAEQIDLNAYPDWNSCYNRGPAQQYISYFYGEEAANTTGLPPLGPFPFGKGENCSKTVPYRDEIPTVANAFNVGAVAGGIVGVIALIVVVTLAWRFRKKIPETFINHNRDQEGKTNRIGTAEERLNSDILVTTQDDISTLGDPAGMLTSQRFETDETVKSVDYDYQAGDQAEGESSLRLSSLLYDANGDKRESSKEFSTPTFQGLLGKRMEDSLFADDASFERQFSQMEESFEVTAPAGKLGMVLDTPNGGVPTVHLIKETSVLAGKVIVGDRLVSVDNEDTTEYTAVQVSKLISQKEKEKERILGFIRTKAVSFRGSSFERSSSPIPA